MSPACCQSSFHPTSDSKLELYIWFPRSHLWFAVLPEPPRHSQLRPCRQGVPAPLRPAPFWARAPSCQRCGAQPARRSLKRSLHRPSLAGTSPAAHHISRAASGVREWQAAGMGRDLQRKGLPWSRLPPPPTRKSWVPMWSLKTGGHKC